MEIQHFGHKHPLTLVLNDVDRGDHCCKICFEKLEWGSNHYGCKECGLYNIHKPCAEFPRELQHPSHPKHHLLLDRHLPSHPKHHLLLDRHLVKKECANCSSDRFRFKYNCSDHCEFYLCPKCAFLPLIKTLDIHDHPLTLMRKLLPFLCDGCRKEDIGMFYFCSTCLFAVHSNSKCTSLPLIVPPTSTIQAAIHSHPLTLERKLLSFTCDACGNEGKGTFYFCATCSFVAHLDCAFLPSVVQVIRHKHPLNLIDSLPANHSKRTACQLCAKTVDTNYWLYYCSSHDFVAHLHCATSKEDRDETFVPNSKYEEDRPNNYIDLLPYIVKKPKPGGDRTEIQTEIEHFSHKHDLKLTNELGINKKCDACIRSIVQPPFYACAECGFFLHKSCAELPKKLRHSVHRHPLKLLLIEHDDKKNLLFDCCLRYYNGFSYRCDECNFDLDVHCSLIADIFTHPSHEHELILARSSEAKNCSVCGSRRGYKFSCVDCDFTLDFKCLTLPRMVNYKNHYHPFTLCYSPEDDSGEYYCDICEKIRDPKRWFYYCTDCSYPAHPECILEKEYPNFEDLGTNFRYRAMRRL